MFKSYFLPLLLIFAFEGYAKSGFVADLDQAAKNLYGSAASYTFSCNGCHGNGGPPALETGFGMDFKNGYLQLYPNLNLNGLGAAEIQEITKFIASKDSDNDGASNQAELTAGTNPGDSASKPVADPCVAAPPSLLLNPSTQQGEPGSSLVYNMSILNNDSSTCKDSNFTLSNQVQSSDISVQMEKDSIVLGAGKMDSLKVTITSLAGAQDSSQEFQINVNDAAEAIHNSSVKGLYVIKKVASACVRKAPQIEISPAKQSAEAGNILSYSLTVLNSDSAECNEASFDLAATTPLELKASLSQDVLTLGPGKSASVTISVESALNAAAGDYNFMATASSSNVAEHEASATATYVVTKANDEDNIAPTAPTNLVGKQKGPALAIVWDASTDNVSVVKYSIWVDGVLTKETARRRARLKLSAGTYKITVKAHDAAGNASLESNEVTVTIKSKK